MLWRLNWVLEPDEPSCSGMPYRYTLNGECYFLRQIFERSADILVCRCAGFPTCGARRQFHRFSCYRRFADWKVGGTADKNVCATSEGRSLLLVQQVRFLPVQSMPIRHADSDLRCLDSDLNKAGSSIWSSISWRKRSSTGSRSKAMVCSTSWGIACQRRRSFSSSGRRRHSLMLSFQFIGRTVYLQRQCFQET